MKTTDHIYCTLPILQMICTEPEHRDTIAQPIQPQEVF